jgi:hypothetical protein
VCCLANAGHDVINVGAERVLPGHVEIGLLSTANH